MINDANHILATTVTVEDVLQAAQYMNEREVLELTQEQRDELAKRLCGAIQEVIEDFVTEI